MNYLFLLKLLRLKTSRILLLPILNRLQSPLAD